MKNILKFAVGVAGILSLSPAVRATVLMNNQGDTITASSLQQYGRIGRSTLAAPHNQQSWDPKVSGETTFPGAVNIKSSDTPTVYNYVTYTFTPAQIGNGQFVEININEPGASGIFVSAWTTYSGSSSLLSGTGFLGDAAQSENYVGLTDRRYFDVIVPKGANLVVVVNTTTDAGIGEPYGIQVNAYATRDYIDATPSVTPDKAPRPGTGGGAAGEIALIGGAAVIRRRRRGVSVV